MHFKSNRAEGWYRILVHQRTTEAIGVTFEVSNHCLPLPPSLPPPLSLCASPPCCTPLSHFALMLHHSHNAQALSSVIYSYSIPTLEAISGGSGHSSEPYSGENWFCLIWSSYRWEYGQFGQCSTTCGFGKKFKRAVCVDYSTRREVEDWYCSCHDPPPVIVQSCGTKLCKPR